MDTAIDPDTAWNAFARRDRAFDGRFIVAVRTTHIYCKPSCAARRPRRENVTFLNDAAAARAAGYRPCRRCLPDSVARDRAAVIRAAASLAAHDHPPALSDLAAEVGYAPHHFHRLFRRLTGITPAGYARALRAERAAAALRSGGSVTGAIYDAGYGAPSRFYADAARLGMTPTAVAEGGAGETVQWVTLPGPLGTMLLAATAKGWCHVAFEAGAESLRAIFPAATLIPGDAMLGRRAAELIAGAASVPTDASLPRDLRETAFRELLHLAAIEIG